MATHSSILAWKIPWTEKPDRLQSKGLQRVGHDWSDLACMCAYPYPLTHLRPKSGFPGRSASKECAKSACNAGDPGSIPGLGRSHREGIGYPLQYSWASLVVQSVKNPPTMRETWVWSLGWEDPPEEAMTSNSSILTWRIPWTEEPGRLQLMGLQRVGYDWAANNNTRPESPRKSSSCLKPTIQKCVQNLLSFFFHSISRGMQTYQSPARPWVDLWANFRLRNLL